MQQNAGAAQTRASSSTKYDDEYARIIASGLRPLRVAPVDDRVSLAQPSPTQEIASVVTYGAYERPILGEMNAELE